jgi:hypothetical protein
VHRGSAFAIFLFKNSPNNFRWKGIFIAQVRCRDARDNDEGVNNGDKSHPLFVMYPTPEQAPAFNIFEMSRYADHRRVGTLMVQQEDRYRLESKRVKGIVGLVF